MREPLITELEEYSVPRRRKKTSHRPLLTLIADVAAAGILLCTFALFHHVLPQTYTPVSPPSILPDGDTDDSTLSEIEKTFNEHFEFTPQTTENTYRSKNITIDVTTHIIGEGNNKSTYYVADIYVRSIECFRTAFAKDTFGRGLNEPLLNISKRNNALLAISGDYYGLHNNGPVIRNGVLYRSRQSNADVCVLYRDGTMKTFAGGSFNADAAMDDGAWQSWSFGPSLLDANGKAATSFNSTLTTAHPRCAIGYYKPGHYAFVLVDGRQDNYSEGMTLSELAKLFESLGCKVAYNLDGGRSAQMAFAQTLVNQPYLDGRNISDILYIGEVE